MTSKRNNEKETQEVFDNMDNDIELTEESKSFLNKEDNATNTEAGVSNISKQKKLSTAALIALSVLVLQNASVALVGRVALADHKVNSDTIVVAIEATKFLLATVGVLCETNFKVHKILSELWTFDSLKMAVPAILYFVQNNLVLMSLERLPAAVFQVTYQCKILTTALFSVLWLKRSMTRMQVVSLFILTVGVAIVQMSKVKPTDGSEYTVADQIAGFVYVIIACCLSGTAGVYFEFVLKDSQQSVMMRNVELAGFTLLLGAPMVVYRRYDDILANGVFENYTKYVWGLVCLQSVGGFIVAFVVKYADQVQKGFAVSFAIVVASVFSQVVFGTELAFTFWCGATLVVSSVFFYNYFK